MMTAIGFALPRSMETESTAAADTEWMEVEPASNGMRERPLAMSSASAMRTIPASSVSGLPPERCEMMACRISERRIVARRGSIDLGKELAELLVRDEQAVRLVVRPVDRHAEVVQQRR